MAASMLTTTMMISFRNGNLFVGLLGITATLYPAELVHGTSVTIRNTTIVGTESSGQEFFGGIPFAEPPVGSLRFKPPVFKGTLDVPTFNATNWGSQCVQPPSSPPIPQLVPTSEDCLTLNVFRPAGLSSTAKLPVMIWVYGGGFTGGSSAEYNASALVSRSIARGTPIIYVNLNYRLGALGFPQGQEAASKGALNLGLKDQLAALKWIRENIHVFGGDKDKVTMFGESAGSISISVLFLNSNLERLVRGAIFHSGTAGTTFTFDAVRRQNVWSDFVSFVPECASLATAPHANTFDCLRNVSSDTILNAFNEQMAISGEQGPWVPTIDGPEGLIPDHPATLFAQGKFSKIAFIAGTNLDEGTEFTSQSVNSSKVIREWIITNHTASSSDIPALEKIASQLLQLYPDNPALGSPFNTGNETFGLSSQYKRLAAIMGDLLFQSVRRSWIQSAVKHGVKAFGYMFTDPPPAPLNLPASGVFHAVDLLYIYPDIVPGIELGPQAEKLSEQMMDYWLSFATSLDPSDGKGGERLTWSRYTSGDNALLMLNSENMTIIQDDYRKEQIEFINKNGVLLSH